MKVKIEIKYNWVCDQGIEIPVKHKEALKEHAFKRITVMAEEGYHQGELLESVQLGKDEVPEEEEEDGLSYSGWWKISTSVE